MIKSKIVGIIALSGLLFTVASAAPLSTSTRSQATSTRSLATSTKLRAGPTQKLSQIIDRSNQEIDRRITDLNTMNVKVSEMKKVSVTEKSTIASEVQSEITSLTALKTKIDADTDAAVAQSDERSIFGSYRIYALVIPQSRILVSADRIDTVAGLLTNVSTKLQSRITALKTSGKDVTTLQAELADMNNKIANATTQAQTARTTVGPLVPDQGDKGKAQNNSTILAAGRVDVKEGTKDLKDAQKEARAIVQGIKAINPTPHQIATTTKKTATTTGQ